MRRPTRILMAVAGIYVVLLLLHYPLLRLPYFWDEAGYYIPAALDFLRHGLLIPRSTQPEGHPPLLIAYLGVVWRIFGFSELVTRAAMVLIAAATVLATYALARREVSGELAFWSAALLALSPVFFAQSSLALLDLAAALFTTLAVLFLLEESQVAFAVVASLAVMTKETAVVMLPAMWAFAFYWRRARGAMAWMALAFPLLPLAAWAVYYHHSTGYWTGNAYYLQYNLYSILTPLHVFRNFIARVAEVFIQGFNFGLTGGAIAGFYWVRSQRGQRSADREERSVLPCKTPPAGRKVARHAEFLSLAGLLIAVYILMLSFVGGAVLSRYLLPVAPFFIISGVKFIGKLPRRVARFLVIGAACCFVGACFINPPYPFPYENNLSYADFVRLHQQAARFLEALPGNPVILTTWPATDELRSPAFGYVSHPLRIHAVNDFTAAGFKNTPPFEVLYLYSRSWEPTHDPLILTPRLLLRLERFFSYRPQVKASNLQHRFHLKLLKCFERRGQWVRIYERAPAPRAAGTNSSWAFHG